MDLKKEELGTFLYLSRVQQISSECYRISYIEVTERSLMDDDNDHK